MIMSIEEQIRTMVEKILNEQFKLPLKDRDEERSEELPDLSKIYTQGDLRVPNPKNKGLYQEMKRTTPARLGVWRSGTRPLTQTWLKFRADHALAQDSVMGIIPDDFPERYNMIAVQTLIENKDQYLTRPDLGRKFSHETKHHLRRQGAVKAQVQIVVSDGLSSKAVEANIPDLLPSLLQGLKHYGIQCGPPIFVRYGRVACMDEIGEALSPEALILLIGERPGLVTAESLSAYLAYRPHPGMLESERAVVSNIHAGGTPPVEAGAHLATILKQILTHQRCGVDPGGVN